MSQTLHSLLTEFYPLCMKISTCNFFKKKTGSLSSLGVCPPHNLETKLCNMWEFFTKVRNEKGGLNLLFKTANFTFELETANALQYEAIYVNKDNS